MVAEVQATQTHHDVICVGFNPSAISLAIKLRESSPNTDVLYLERESREAWKPNGDLPGHIHMQTNLLNDLVTLENPRSAFTFINFLHQKRLLVDFTNLGAMEPLRGQFEEYLSWCAEPFQSSVEYGQEVSSIEPVHSSEKKIVEWNVFMSGRESGQRRIATARNVVICLDKQPIVPSFLSKPELKKHVVQAAHSTKAMEEMLVPTRKNVAIAIIGQSQEAAELFEYLYDARADREVIWLSRPHASRADSRTVAAAVDERYPPELRAAESGNIKPSVTSGLTAKLDEIQYAQTVKPSDPQRYRIEAAITVNNAALTSSSRIELSGIDQRSNEFWRHEFDLAISANGYTRQSPKPMLDSIISSRLLDGPTLTTNADYHVNLRRTVAEQNVGLWCIGLVGQPEIAVGEAALTVTAERSVRVARDLLPRLGHKRSQSPSQGQSRVQAQL